MILHHLRLPRTAGLVLQPRDLELLRLVVNHRFLKSDHLRALLDQRMPRRVLQVRLQKLSRFRYLRRLYVPVVLDGVHAPLTHSRQPIYTLDSRGVQLLRDLTPPGRPALYERPEQPSYHFLSHHLVATDCLVALTVASRHTTTVKVVATEAESLLWRRLLAYRRTYQTARAIVPDGTFTLHYPATGEVVTFYLEVVRADVKGGNAALLGKLRRYVELNRQGFFRKVYGHDHVRAVLFATTSPARAAHLTALAEQLTEGRRLFWFGPYQEKLSAGRLVSLFTPERLLALPWVDGAGTTAALLDPTARPPSGDGHH